MTVERSEQTQQVYDNLIYRAQKFGLNDKQEDVWMALVEWFENNVDGPTNRELSKLANVSLGTVCWTMPILEALGYITMSRRSNGTIISASIRLWVYPEGYWESIDADI